MAKEEKVVGLSFTDKIISVIYGIRNLEKIIIEKKVTVDLPEGIIRGGEVINSEKFKIYLRNLFIEELLPQSNIILGIPDEKIVKRIVNTPIMPRKEIKDYIRGEISQYVIFRETEPIINFVIQQQSTKGFNIFFLATGYEYIASYISLLEEIGLTVKAVYPNSLSLVSIFFEKLDTTKNIALVIMGDKTTQVYVIKDNIFQFIRTLDYGTSTLVVTNPEIEEVTEEYVVNLDEFTTELDDSLKFYTTEHGEIVEQLVFCTDFNIYKNLDKFLQNRLVINVIRAPIDIDIEHNFYIPFGLIKCYLKEKLKAQLNLLPKPIAKLRKLKIEALGFLLIPLIIILIIFSLMSRNYENKINSKINEIKKLDEKIAQLQTTPTQIKEDIEKEIEYYKIQNQKLKESEHQTIVISSPAIYWSGVLKEIRCALPKNTWLVDTTYEDNIIRFTGYSTTQRAIAQLLINLRNSEFFENIVLEISEVTQIENQNCFKFVISCKVRRR